MDSVHLRAFFVLAPWDTLQLSRQHRSASDWYNRIQPRSDQTRSEKRPGTRGLRVAEATAPGDLRIVASGSARAVGGASRLEPDLPRNRTQDCLLGTSCYAGPRESDGESGQAAHKSVLGKAVPGVAALGSPGSASTSHGSPIGHPAPSDYHGLTGAGSGTPGPQEPKTPRPQEPSYPRTQTTRQTGSSSDSDTSVHCTGPTS